MIRSNKWELLLLGLGRIYIFDMVYEDEFVCFVRYAVKV